MGKHSSDEKQEKQEKKTKREKTSITAPAAPAAKKPGKAKRTSKETRAVRQKRRTVGGKRKPLSDFNLFAAQRRAALQREMPFLTFAQLSKAVGDEWSTLLDEQKAPYIAEAKRLREEAAKSVTASPSSSEKKTEKKKAKAE